MTRFDFDVIGDPPQKPLPELQKPASPPPVPPQRPRDGRAQDEAGKAA